MIKFFRRIRKKLLTENKSASSVGRFPKYLIYAIGEIVLVVIGILIALQINNWNENKKKTKKEIFHLENVLNNLQDDLSNQIIPCIEKTEQQILGFELLNAGFYQKDQISNDSIKQLFFQFLAQWDLVLNTVAFDNLKSAGMDILSNDSIQTSLLTIYGNNYKNIKNYKEYYDMSHYDRISTTIALHEIDWFDKLTAEDRQSLKNDKGLYLNMKGEAYYALSNYLNSLKEIQPISQELIENITQEIKRLKEK